MRYLPKFGQHSFFKTAYFIELFKFDEICSLKLFGGRRGSAFPQDRFSMTNAESPVNTCIAGFFLLRKAGGYGGSPPLQGFGADQEIPRFEKANSTIDNYYGRKSSVCHSFAEPALKRS